MVEQIGITGFNYQNSLDVSNPSTPALKMTFRQAFTKHFARKPVARRQALDHELIYANGKYFIQEQHQSPAIIVMPTARIVSHVFLDLLTELGEEVIFIVGETVFEQKPIHLMSFSPTLAASRLQILLAGYHDIIKRHPGIEISVTNTRKCCSLVLSASKHIFLNVCALNPYIRLLESRGIRQTDEISGHSPIACAKAMPVDEIRLDEMKQLLTLSTAAFCPQQELLH